MKVCENIKRVRKAKGISQAHMAKGLGLSMMGYCHLENNDVRLDVERLKKIGAMLSVDCTVFFSDRETDLVIERAGG